MNQPVPMTARAATRPGLPATVRWSIRVLDTLLLLVLTFFLARLVWLIAFGASAQAFEQAADTTGRRGGRAPAFVADLSRLREPGLFAGGDTAATAAVRNEVLPETRLDLTLRGIRVGATPQTGGAIVQTPDGRQSFFSVGEALIEGVALDAVHVDHIVIDRRGLHETLFLRDASGGATRATSALTVPAGPGAASGDLIEAGLFRFEPVSGADGLTGYRVLEQNAEALRALGLRPGDTVTAIDGRLPASASELRAVLTALGSRDRVTLSILRGRTPQTVTVDLP